MKRIKIMLACIGVLAGVGGALAFKANTVRSGLFCVLGIIDGAGVRTCIVTTFGKIGGGASVTYATVFPNGVIHCTLANGGAGAPCGLTRFTTMEP